MILPILLPPERVREIAVEAHRGLFTTTAVAVAENAIDLAAPEIAAAALEWAAKWLERKAAELQIAKQTDEVLLNRAVRLDDADILRQLAKEITDGK